MTIEQLSDEINRIGRDVAAMQEKLSSAHKQLDKNDLLTEQIHRLATSVETLAIQVKTQNEKMEKIVDALESRLLKLETKSGKRWDAVVEKIILVVVGAVVAYILTNIGL